MDSTLEGLLTGLAIAAMPDTESNGHTVDVAFERTVRAYAKAVNERVVDSPGHRKDLDRIGQTLDALLDLEATKPSVDRRRATERAIVDDPSALSEGRTAIVLSELKGLLIEGADRSSIYAMADDETHWTKRMTSWLTWDQLFGSSDPPGMSEYLAGKDPKPEDVEATRRRLSMLQTARLDDIQVHRSRIARRGRNLFTLWGVLLAILLAAVGTAIASARVDSALIVIAIFSGMMGSAISWTMKARDALVRASDIESFQQALPAQLLVGGVAALAIVALLEAGLISLTGFDLGTWQSIVAIGFVAGYSEPFVLGSIRKVTALGETPSDSKTATDKS